MDALLPEEEKPKAGPGPYAPAIQTSLMSQAAMQNINKQYDSQRGVMHTGMLGIGTIDNDTTTLTDRYKNP